MLHMRLRRMAAPRHQIMHVDEVGPRTTIPHTLLPSQQRRHEYKAHERSCHVSRSRADTVRANARATSVGVARLAQQRLPR